jgi:hypothetical protein
MPDRHYAHLELTRLDLTPPRRRGGGGGVPVQKHEDTERHGDQIRQNLFDAEETIIQHKPNEFDPGLLMKLRIQAGTIDEEALRSFGIEIVSEESEGTLIVFFDERARQEFLARLDRYKAGESGRGVSANVFHAIEGVSTWTREDRLGRVLRGQPWSRDSRLVVDIELWPRESRQSNRRECELTAAWLTQHGAEVWDQLSTDSVVLIRVYIDGQALDEALELETIRIIDTPPALYLDDAQYDLPAADISIEGPSEGENTLVGVLDSGVVAGHPLIGPAISEAASFITGRDASDETGHGTAVVGFTLYGDIDGSVKEKHFKTNVKVLSGKVLSGNRDEYDRRLIANQVIDAVNYFNGELGCKIFNVSFGDRNQPYDGRHVRGLASVIDELSRERNILFVVSAGNFSGTESAPQDWRAEYPSYLFGPDARIIDPAPALNALTVGSLARYDKDRHAQRYPQDVNNQPIARVDEPSPFTRTGPGPNGSIKPDVVEYGGNIAVDLRTGGKPKFDPPDPNISEIALKHAFAGNRLFTPMIGSSFASPKVAHIAANILREYPDVSPNLIRVLILLNATLPENAAQLFPAKDELVYFSYGYGRPDKDKSLYSSETCVTLVAEGSIGADQTHFYEIPLPDDFLVAGRFERTMEVALAHCPPCRSTRLSYKGSKISFKIVVEDNVDTLTARFQAESDLENVPEWGDFKPGSQLRSKGTAMAAKKTIKVLSTASQLLRGKRLFIVVTHQAKDWAKNFLNAEEQYALAVTIEDRARQDLRLYTQLRARLRARARARV